MIDTAILKPVFVQVALTFFMLFWMAKERLGARARGEVEAAAPGVRPAWKARAGIVSNAFHNQLEMPMLFYVAVAFAMIANGVDDIMLMLAWAYVVLRLVHAAIHTTYNHIPHRFLVYVVSNLVALAMWVKLAIHVL